MQELHQNSLHELGYISESNVLTQNSALKSLSERNGVAATERHFDMTYEIPIEILKDHSIA